MWAGLPNSYFLEHHSFHATYPTILWYALYLADDQSSLYQTTIRSLWRKEESNTSTLEVPWMYKLRKRHIYSVNAWHSPSERWNKGTQCGWDWLPETFWGKFPKMHILPSTKSFCSNYSATLMFITGNQNIINHNKSCNSVQWVIWRGDLAVKSKIRASYA